MRRLALSILLLAAAMPVIAAESPDLLVAIRKGDHSQVQKLMAGGAEENTPAAPGPKMRKLLVDRGANVNAKNNLGSTALMYAATNLAKARLLVEAGADVKARAKFNATPLSVAVTTFGSTPVLKLLVSKGAETEPRLIAGAAAMGDVEAMQYLFSIGVSASSLGGPAIAGAIGARCEAC